MKKQLWKRALSLGLTMIVIVGLAACGKGDSDGNGGSIGGGNNSKGNKGNSNSELAKQYVYSYEELDLGLDAGTYNIQNVAAKDGKIAVFVDIMANSSDSYDKYGVAEYAAVDDAAATGEGEEGNETQTGDTEDEVVDEENDIFRVCLFDQNGGNMQSTDLTMPSQEGLNIENCYLTTVKWGEDNQYYGVMEYYSCDESDPDNPVYNNWQDIICWGEDGSVKWTQSMQEIQGEEDYFYVNGMQITQNGEVHIFCGGSKYYYVTLAADGSVAGRETLNEDALHLQNSGSIFLKPDGTLFVTFYNDNYTRQSAVTYDPSTKAVSDVVELPGTLNNYSMSAGAVTDLLLSDSNGVYTYNLGDEAVKQIMNFINSDLETSYLNSISMLDEQHFVASYQDNVDYNTHVALFSYVDPSTIPDKTVLTLGANYLAYDIKNRVVEFNKTNEKYRITVQDYANYNTMEDYRAGYTQLNNDIITGKMPDILVADTNLQVSNYIAKGLIADISPYLDKDEEFSRDDFLPNVLEAFSTDGKLYYVVPSFTVSTVIGKSSILGGKTGWTMEEFKQFMSTMPEGTSGFGDMTRDNIMYWMMRYNGSAFINQETGDCSFDSDEFIQFLEYAKTFPAEINRDYDTMDWNAYEMQYRNNETVLMALSIYNIQDLNSTIYGSFGEDVDFVGFPNAQRAGSVLNADTTFVLSSKSKDLDGAWEFVRYFLSDEYQENIGYGGLPVKRKYFDEAAQLATQKPYWIDENGNKVEYDQTTYIGGEEVTLDPMTQEQVDRIKTFIESVNRQSYDDSSVMDIINEEAAPFYEGQKSAADVAQIIQSRIEIYINESR